MSKTEISVVGGGYLGMLAARELAIAGCQVTIFDQGTLGRESSWAGGGILSPLHPWNYADAVNDLARWSQGHYADLVKSLLESTGVDPEWVRSGLLILEDREQETAANWAEKYAYTLRSVDKNEILEIQPSIQPGTERGIWMPDIAQVRNPRLLASIKRDLILKKVELRENCRIDGFEFSAGRLQSLRAGGETIVSDRCLVTAGAWTGDLLAATGLKVDVRPMMGQMLLLQAHPQQLTRILLREKRYLIPRRDGRILVGSTLEDTGYQKRITGSVAQELHSFATSLVPALEQVPVEMQWAGLRPASPEGIPYMGQHPDIEGLYLCAGHYRNGFVTGPASARLISDLMLGREPVLDPGPYDPAARVQA
jgi:glycine oxidase